MSLDDIDREAMREGKAISKLRDFRGSRTRTKKEPAVRVEEKSTKRAWNSLFEDQK